MLGILSSVSAWEVITIAILMAEKTETQGRLWLRSLRGCSDLDLPSSAPNVKVVSPEKRTCGAGVTWL